MRKKFPLALPFKKLLGNGFLKFVTVLFCTNGIVFLMGPLPHKFDKRLFHIEAAAGDKPPPYRLYLSLRTKE